MCFRTVIRAHFRVFCALPGEALAINQKWFSPAPSTMPSRAWSRQPHPVKSAVVIAAPHSRPFQGMPLITVISLLSLRTRRGSLGREVANGRRDLPIKQFLSFPRVRQAGNGRQFPQAFHRACGNWRDVTPALSVSRGGGAAEDKTRCTAAGNAEGRRLRTGSALVPIP